MYSFNLLRRTQSGFNTIKRYINLLCDKAYVNGKWIEAASQKTFPVKNPANDSVVACVPDMNRCDTRKAIKKAHEAFQTWQYTTGKERGLILRNFHWILTARLNDLAKIITLESGKPFSEAAIEVQYGNNYIEFFSEEARRLGGMIISSPIKSKRYYVTREPTGVNALLTPWNFPHAMIARKASAALAAGCTVIIKPSEDTPLTALAMAQCAEEAGIPKGVFNVITTSRNRVEEVGESLVNSELIAGVSFTGSTAVGKLIYGQGACTVKRLSLELGGNAPFIVFESADLEMAVRSAISAKFRNCGQTCVAANRFLVQNDLYEQFVNELAIKMQENLRVGDGMDETKNIGPMINKTQYSLVCAMVEDAVSKGAKVILGGKPAEQGGLFYEPTILTCMNESMEMYKKEIFGPVVQVFPFENESEAIEIANNTRSGLAAYIFTQNMSQIDRVTRQLEVGMVGVNEGAISACEVPFGGVKESGFGREGSHLGLDEYTNYKYVCIGNMC